MIESRQALDSAIKEISQRIDLDTIADIIVEPGETHYSVHLVPFIPLDEEVVESLVVEIHNESGMVSTVKMLPAPNPTINIAEDIRNTNISSGLQAYQVALNAIKGYEHYDKFGRLKINLDKDRYIVTFPDPNARADGGRTADYTYQVWIDVKTLQVSKILAAS